MPSALLSRRLARQSSIVPSSSPILEFLAPSIATPHRKTKHISPIHTARVAESLPTGGPPPSSTDSSAQHESSNSKPTRPLSQSQRDFLDSALRVNQAGELAAILIYASQTPPLIRSHPHLRPLMSHMYTQEASHYHTFNSLLSTHRIRPTAMTPFWTLAASTLGWGTAILGREAAMACTEAVETEIGTHYNEQVREMLAWAEEAEKRGETLGTELEELVKTLRRIRDEELEHLDHAVLNDAKEARPYELLTNVIRGGCRAAIWVSEKV